MLVSAFITPRNFEITHNDIKIKNLPSGFENFKIVQISDIHLGSWNNDTSKLSLVVDLINNEHPDLIVFTGDMVNNFACETHNWKSIFLQLNAKTAKLAILGNHDYGDYTLWKTEDMRIENRESIQWAIRSFGFQLLLNEKMYLQSNNDSLLLVGVENWGKTEATRYSNLKKALAGSSSEELKILLTHDPNHWEAEVIGRKDIVLTLSGHTHAAQAGIKIGGKLFSPASFVFKYWSGLYEKNDQQLYVNRGVGYIGLPLFIGVRPEITVLILKNK
jgi:predicted MPP superfamily phosphohydrolase